MDEAARVFTGLGFRLTPRGHHTLGSMNHLMMFATDYLELLGFGEGGANRPELAPFPVGLNGLVFKTADADATHARATAAARPILPGAGNISRRWSYRSVRCRRQRAICVTYQDCAASRSGPLCRRAPLSIRRWCSSRAHDRGFPAESVP